MLNASLSWPLLSNGITCHKSRDAHDMLEIILMKEPKIKAQKNKKKDLEKLDQCGSNTLNNPS